MQVSYSLLSYVFKDIYKFHVMYLNTKFVLVMVPHSFFNLKILVYFIGNIFCNKTMF